VLLALSLIVKVPGCNPVVVGRNVKAKVQLAPAANVVLVEHVVDGDGSKANALPPDITSEVNLSAVA
jgi:hypothetical protein